MIASFDFIRALCASAVSYMKACRPNILNDLNDLNGLIV